MKINTTAEVARELGISEQRVRQLVRELSLTPQRIGKAIVLSDAEIEAMRQRPIKQRRAG